MADTKLFSVNGKTYIGNVYDYVTAKNYKVEVEVDEDEDEDTENETATTQYYIAVEYPALIESSIAQTGESTNTFTVSWSITPLCFSAMMTSSDYYSSNIFYFPVEDISISAIDSSKISDSIKNSWKSITGQS